MEFIFECCECNEDIDGVEIHNQVFRMPVCGCSEGNVNEALRNEVKELREIVEVYKEIVKRATENLKVSDIFPK